MPPSSSNHNMKKRKTRAGSSSTTTNASGGDEREPLVASRSASNNRNNKRTKRTHSSSSKQQQRNATAAAVPSSSEIVTFPPCKWVHKKKKGKTGVDTEEVENSTSSTSLTKEQAALWMHPFSASAAVAGHYPVGVYRYLGTISREVVVPTTTTSSKKKKKSSSSKTAVTTSSTSLIDDLPHPSKSRGATRRIENREKKMTTHQANKQAMKEVDRAIITKSKLIVRTNQILLQWNTVLEQQSNSSSSNHCNQFIWDHDDGHPGSGWTRLSCLEDWLHNIILADDNHQQAAELLDIVEACRDLHCAHTLWEIPLLQVYITVKEGTTNNTNNANSSATIRMGVYMHRFLTEALTTTLGTVMNALDEGSFIRTQELAVIPTTSGGGGPQVFESAPYPKVCIRDDDLNTDDNNNDNNGANADDGGGGEEGMTTRNDATISAFTPTGLLKLLENHGTDTSAYETQIAPKLQGILKLDLLLHQKHGVCWMYAMEHLPSKLGLNSLLWEEREFNDCGNKYYYSPCLGQLRLDPPHSVLGGLLCDEQGLGKTIEVLSLIAATRDDLRKGGSADDEATTLIVVPPALVAQWQAEIVKSTGSSLSVDYLDYKTGELQHEVSNPDIVLTTYNALDKNKHCLKYLEEKKWGRIVLDEMQEIRSTTTQIAKTCEKLQAKRRWMLSGTPLFDGIEDFRGELNFLRLEPFAANNEDGFFQFAVTDAWESHNPKAIQTLQNLAKVLLRRSKSMTIKATGEPILGLEPLTVEFVPVQQTVSERALYYYMESVISGQRSAVSATRRKAGSRAQLLRLLRDLCTSPMLLNGGMGANSSLKALNQLLIDQTRNNRRAARANAQSRRGSIPVMNCDEAIMHLAAMQESTRTNDGGEVATMQLGFGQGVVRRGRAVDSVEEKMKASKDIIHSATKDLKASTSARAKARWHWALEMVTTGQMPFEDLANVTQKFRTLWSWRSIYAAVEDAKLHASTAACNDSPSLSGSTWWSLFGSADTTTSNNNIEALPEMLTRGWRLSNIGVFCNDLLQKRNFFWTRPYSYFLCSIPNTISIDKIEQAILSTIKSGNLDDKPVISEHHRDPKNDTWGAGIVFTNKAPFSLVMKEALKASGIKVGDMSFVPQHEEKLKALEDAAHAANTAYTINPSDANKHELHLARKRVTRLKEGGLKIVKSQLAGESNILISYAHSHFRAMSTNRPGRGVALNKLQSLIADAGTTIAVKMDDIIKEQKKVDRLQNSRLSISEDVQQLSAVDQLQNLANGQNNKTYCCICLDTLGSTANSEDDSNTIVMTKCSHLYCTKCLHDYTAGRQEAPCPTCRKTFLPHGEVVLIDPSKQESQASIDARRSHAKQIVQEASKKLEESNGLLDPSLWEKLYQACDLPAGADSRRDAKVSAIPGDFLAHLRACTGMPAVAPPNSVPQSDQYFSSKVKALLRDLPRGGKERSVVFASSREVIKHLEQVFSVQRIGCRSLFSGQPVSECEKSVSEWQSGNTDEETGEEQIPFPVLLVQSGAAASGLTLTAACKMFLIEPFLRYEEEQQAYARCHRYSQTNPVHCKVYYVQISVESRLLEWRKQAVAAAENSNLLNSVASAQDARIVYSTIDIDDDDDDDDDDEEEEEDPFEQSDEDGDDPEETNQTAFLLGLHNT